MKHTTYQLSLACSIARTTGSLKSHRFHRYAAVAIVCGFGLFLFFGGVF